MDAFIPAMYFGLLVQLLWLGNLPIGASKTPEGNIASIVGCWLYVEYYTLYADQGQFILLVLFVYVVLLSYIASRTDTFMRKINIHFFDYAYDSLQQKESTHIGRMIFASLGVHTLINWLYIMISLLVGRFVLQNLSGYFSAGFADIWKFVETAILAAGIGLIIGVYKDLKLKKIIIVIALVTMVMIRVV